MLVPETPPRSKMIQNFYENPVLNSPYECPKRHWKLGADGKPTGEICEFRRVADFVTPFPNATPQHGVQQQNLTLDETDLKLKKLGEEDYHRSLINEIRTRVSEWRNADQKDWRVTATTALLLKYWRSLNSGNGGVYAHSFASSRR